MHECTAGEPNQVHKALSAMPGANHVFTNLNWFFPLLRVIREPPPHIFIEMKGVFYIGSADGF